MCSGCLVQAIRSLLVACDRNSLPFDVNGAWYTSGLRLGTPALTSLGMGRDEERRRRQRARMGPNSDNPLLSRPIADLGLSVRGRSCMQRLGIVSIGDLVKAVKSHKEYENRMLRDYITGTYA